MMGGGAIVDELASNVLVAREGNCILYIVYCIFVEVASLRRFRKRQSEAIPIKNIQYTIYNLQYTIS